MLLASAARPLFVMRSLLIVALAALMLAPAGFAAAGAREAPALEPAASWVAGKPVRVYCDQSLALTTETGMAVVGGSDVRLAPIVCADLRATLAGRWTAAVGPSASLLTLAHEAEHAQGHALEGETE